MSEANILGTNYKIFFKNEQEEPRLKKKLGVF